MPRPTKRLFVSNTGIATSSNVIGASGTVSQKLTQGFPTGDALLYALKLRHSGNLNLSTSGAGAIIGRGGLVNIRGLWLQTPQHGIIINGLDGLAIHTIQYIRQGVRPVNTDIASANTGTPTFDYHVPLDFRDRLAARPEDTCIDLFRVSYMELVYNVGGATDYISGGTYTTETIQVLNLEMHAVVDPGAVDPTAVPIFKPYWDILKIPINQTATQFQIVLPYGGRLIKRYYIHQRKADTLLEAPNTIIGVNDQDRVSMLVGGYSWINRVEWLALQDENVTELRLAGGIPTGLAVMNFANIDANGYMASELLGLNSQNGATPQTEIDVDCTSISNGQLWVYTEAQTPIPIDAQRPKASTPGGQ